MPKDHARLVGFPPRLSYLRAPGTTNAAASADRQACDPDAPAAPSIAANRAPFPALARAEAKELCPLACLTPRQRQVMALVLAGHPSKIIAADLTISRRTVENHRAAIMRRTGATSLPALVRLSLGVA